MNNDPDRFPATKFSLTVPIYGNILSPRCYRGRALLKNDVMDWVKQVPKGKSLLFPSSSTRYEVPGMERAEANKHLKANSNRFLRFLKDPWAVIKEDELNFEAARRLYLSFYLVTPLQRISEQEYVKEECTCCDYYTHHVCKHAQCVALAKQTLTLPREYTGGLV